MEYPLISYTGMCHERFPESGKMFLHFYTTKLSPRVKIYFSKLPKVLILRVEGGKGCSGFPFGLMENTFKYFSNWNFKNIIETWFQSC